MAFSLFKKWRIVFYTTEMEHFFRLSVKEEDVGRAQAALRKLKYF